MFYKLIIDLWEAEGEGNINSDTHILVQIAANKQDVNGGK
jgi:hypothetical protein